MKLFRILIVTLLMVFALQANALTQLKVDGLSDDDIAKLNLEAAKMVVKAKEVANKPVVDTMLDKLGGLDISEEALDRYSTIGTKVGKIVTGFLTEIGVTAANFLDTNWGIVAMILVGFHYFGNDMALLGMIVVDLTVLLPIWLLFARNLWFPYKEFNETKIIKGESVKTIVLKRQYDNSLNDSPSGFMITGMLVILLILIVSTMNIG